MRGEYDFSKAKRAKDVPHLAKLQAQAAAATGKTRMKTKPENSVTPWVDPDDAPLLDDAFFKNADHRIGDKVVTRTEAQAAIAEVIKRTRGSGK